MKYLLALAAISGWLIVAYNGFLWHIRANEVRTWAAACYEHGYEDREWAEHGYAKKINKDFAIDGVSLAFNGAWDEAYYPWRRWLP